MRRIGILVVAPLLAAITSATSAAAPQTFEVRAQIVIVQTPPRKSSARIQPSDVVVWLKPLDPPPSFHSPAPERFRMVQKHKSFQPHLLVVPLGSRVAFPNLDPFFHNVFSQFNGKRFDLGLYETGTTRDVSFDHEGVSYIFCNIHPEMSAVIITVTSPWYTISSGGTILFHDVLPGMYEMRVWAGGADARELNALTRKVRIGPDIDNLGVIAIHADEKVETHKNKFGNDYPPQKTSVY